MNLRNKIGWYREPEDRQWKRVWQVVEFCVYSIALIICAITLQLHGDGTMFQLMYVLLSLSLAVSSFLTGVGTYRNKTINRWHTQVMSFGFLSGTGLCSLAGFLIFSIQHK